MRILHKIKCFFCWSKNIFSSKKKNEEEENDVTLNKSIKRWKKPDQVVFFSLSHSHFRFIAFNQSEPNEKYAIQEHGETECIYLYKSKYKR